MKRYALGALLGALVLAAVFLAGRYSAPTKWRDSIQIATRTEYVDRWRERVVYRKAKDTARHVETTTTTTPGGATVTTRIEDSSTHSTASGASNASGSSSGSTVATETRERTSDSTRPSWRVGASWPLVGDGLELTPSRVDGARRILGPLWLGAYVNTRGPFEAGASLAWEF